MATLKFKIRDLLNAAEHASGEKRWVKLDGGLVLECKIESGLVHFQARRQSVYPSTDEWLTLFRHWPVPMASPEFKTARREGWCYLMAHWPVPLALVTEGS